MKTFGKWAVRVAAALVAVAVVAWVGIWVTADGILHKPHAFSAQPLTVGASGPDVARGARLAHVFGCTGCHGPDLRGTVMIDDPMLGNISAPNLTLDAKAWSDAQLAAMIRGGVRPDGRPLFIMPSEAFSRLTDPETVDLIAYLRSLPAGGAAPGATFQPGIVGRLGLIMGKFEDAPTLVAKYRAHPLPDYGPETAGGRNTARLCAACHGPDLKGDMGPDLRIAAAYDLPAFTRLLRQGVGMDGKTVKPVGAPGEKKDEGLMSEVAKANLAGLSDAEIADLHAYLKTRLDHLSN
jgi:mono/diheme cytochrome c family protein